MRSLIPVHFSRDARLDCTRYRRSLALISGAFSCTRSPPSWRGIQLYGVILFSCTSAIPYAAGGIESSQPCAYADVCSAIEKV